MLGKNNNGMGDVDRNDFFQINTYMTYYQNQGYNVKVGGLLYPMERFEEERSHNLDWFGSINTSFIVDGIFIEENSIQSIIKNEKEFIKRVRKY